MHAYIWHIYIYTHIIIYIHIYIYIYIHIYIYIYIYSTVRLAGESRPCCLRTSPLAVAQRRPYLYMYIYMHIYVYIHTYIFTYTYSTVRLACRITILLSANFSISGGTATAAASGQAPTTSPNRSSSAVRIWSVVSKILKFCSSSIESKKTTSSGTFCAARAWASAPSDWSEVSSCCSLATAAARAWEEEGLGIIYMYIYIYIYIYVYVYIYVCVCVPRVGFGTL